MQDNMQKGKNMNIEKHYVDGFTLSKEVKTKFKNGWKERQKVDVSQRYIGFTITEAKQRFRQLCKKVRNSEEHIPYDMYR